MRLNKRFNTLTEYFESIFHKKVLKVSLNMGFTCPNRDGSKGYGGCSFCSALYGGDFAGEKDKSMEEQFIEIKEMETKKWPDALYIPYFQAGTNTYAQPEVLRQMYNEALSLDKDVVGLSISTRPDCLSEEVLEVLEEMNKKTFLIIELGLQTVNEKTLQKINRCHSTACFKEAVIHLKERGIDNIVVHIIDGLEGETKEDMLNTIKFINSLPVNGIKIHLLHLMKDTLMGDEYLKKPWKTITREEYTDIVVSQIEILRSDIIIHRLTGDAPKDKLIEPLWSLKKFVVLNEIDKELRRRNTYQGIYYKKDL